MRGSRAVLVSEEERGMAKERERVVAFVVVQVPCSTSSYTPPKYIEAIIRQPLCNTSSVHLRMKDTLAARA